MKYKNSITGEIFEDNSPRYEEVKVFDNTVIASNGKDFFIISQFDDGTYHRNTGGGLHLHTQDLNYAAIGAEKFETLEDALDSLK